MAARWSWDHRVMTYFLPECRHQPSAFLGGDLSRSFSSDLGFSGDLDLRTAFFSLSAVLEAARFIRERVETPRCSPFYG